MQTLYWHDYETSGTDPARDRPLQFAGVRTDTELNIIGESLVHYCCPADDLLPQPEACLVTGITPQTALAQGVVEAAFIKRIHQEFATPGTCVVGYNNLRFDDEFTRHTLYRNFYDPYAREWQHGNSRWDIIDMVRLTRALRPQDIEWPDQENGDPSFRLEELTAANGIEHGAAHDALSDVYATINLAKLIRARQPRLYHYIFEQRDKRVVARQLDLRQQQPVLHVSSMYPAAQFCTAMVVPVAAHPTNRNGVIVYDLRHDPAALLSLDAQQIRERLFTPRDQLPEGVERIPLKTIHLNKCPVVVPMKTLDEASAQRLQIDIEQFTTHLDLLKGEPSLAAKVAEVFADRHFDPQQDPDLSLYSGGFFGDADRAKMEGIRRMAPSQLATANPAFDDARLPEMLFRYRARNYPQTLSAQEHVRWQVYRMARLTAQEGGGSITLAQYNEEIQRLSEIYSDSTSDMAVLQALRSYAEQLIPATPGSQ
ncbi:MAG: exodeoxyribonuclease I [Gammaproteobacteria bacterium]|nr:exodeoxyribonuclease I [Gammaproteobacteria bacterium]